MSAVRQFLAASVAGFVMAAQPLAAAERVGEAVVVKTSVTGGGGPIVVSSPIHRNERIKTSNSGLGQFVFRDGTKLAVGWGSSVVIDKFVFDDSNTAKKLTIRATKGTFRWISGGSKSTAYEIITPAGTLGVRGTAFDFFVGANGITGVVLYSGSARFCGANGCRTLNRRCDAIVATPSRGVSQPERMRANFMNALGSARALPFLTGNQQLTRSFSVSGGCMQRASLEPRRDEIPVDPRTISPPDTPEPPGKPERPARANSIDRPDRPTAPSREAPERPDKPDRPDRPDRPDYPDHPDEHGEGCTDHDHGGEETQEGRFANADRHSR